MFFRRDRAAPGPARLPRVSRGDRPSSARRRPRIPQGRRPPTPRLATRNGHRASPPREVGFDRPSAPTRRFPREDGGTRVPKSTPPLSSRHHGVLSRSAHRPPSRSTLVGLKRPQAAVPMWRPGAWSARPHGHRPIPPGGPPEDRTRRPWCPRSSGHDPPARSAAPALLAHGRRGHPQPRRPRIPPSPAATTGLSSSTTP